MKTLLMLWCFVFLSISLACESLESERYQKCKPKGSDTPYQYPLDSLGPHFRAQLHLHLLKSHQYLTYSCVWKALSEADIDPVDGSQLSLFYKESSISIQSRDCGQNNPDSWNREHLWAKSRGFPKKSSRAYTDLHHLRVSDRSVNTWRSNRYFVEFTPDEELFQSQNSECIQGCWKDSDYFEPPQKRKGDIARALLYMDLRYEGAKSDRTPDLQLKTSYPPAKTKEGHWGGLCTLLRWHQEDPPDAMEHYRNNVIQLWQGNRNPFIDHPAWVQIIFGKHCK